jgi:hypothetical protein
MYLFLAPRTVFSGLFADEEAAIGELVAIIVDRHGFYADRLLSGPERPTASPASAASRSIAPSPRGDLSIPLGLCLPGSFLAEDGKTAVARILALENDSPDVLVCLNAQMAIGAIREFAANGIAVPEDIAVVAFDDVEESGILSSDLTTVSLSGRYPRYSSADSVDIAERQHRARDRHGAGSFRCTGILRLATGFLSAVGSMARSSKCAGNGDPAEAGENETLAKSR